jgi:hypothetical protein
VISFLPNFLLSSNDKFTTLENLLKIKINEYKDIVFEKKIEKNEEKKILGLVSKEEQRKSMGYVGKAQQKDPLFSNLDYGFYYGYGRKNRIDKEREGYPKKTRLG